MMRRIACVALLLSFSCASDSEPERQSTTACARLREHVIDLRVSEIQQDRDAHRAALRKALGDSYIATCVDEPRERFDCEMKAIDIDGMRNCTSGK